MAAGQAGKVPGAPPRNPNDARSREATRRNKVETVDGITKLNLWRLVANISKYTA